MSLVLGHSRSLNTSLQGQNCQARGARRSRGGIRRRAAVKALHLARGQEVWGRVVAKLIAELPAGVEIPADLPDKARVLDAYYVAPRYPNGHPEGAPFEHHGKLHSDQAMEYAHQIIELVRSRLA